ncbi:MAG: hypothetical protein ACK4FS_05430 [Flavobacterium sp.]
MKFEVGQKVKALNNKCLIIGTKEKPYKPNIDPYLRKEVYPEKDYLLFIFKEIKNGKEIYLGIMDLLENEIDNENW